jgi:hypothetical protein
MRLASDTYYEDLTLMQSACCHFQASMLTFKRSIPLD